MRYHMECIGCGEKVFRNLNFYTCPKCGGLFLLIRDEQFVGIKVGYRKEAMAYFDSIRFSPKTGKYPYGSGVFMWKDFILPGFPDKAVLSLREGFTDLFEPPMWLKRKIGLKKLFVKMEGQGPSGSFKDRGMSVAVSEARRIQIQQPELGIKYICCASTGDTSAAAATYSAYYRDKLKCIVFLPYEKISSGQLSQAMMAGAIVVAIKHPRGFDGCMKLIEEFSAAHSEMVLVNSKNAYRIVGQETAALEIFQDLRWKAPKWISVPVGNGGNLTALMLSCLRARRFGLIDDLPGIIIAQSKAANTIVRWGKSYFKDFQPGDLKSTVASAMNIQSPVSFPRIKKLHSQFEILFYDVEEKEINDTRALFNSAGADICPQGAVALNAVLQAREGGIVKEKDLIVAVSTASGLKFVDSAIEYHLNGRNGFSNPYVVVEGTSIKDIEVALAETL
mgnify:CR=1 FL=1